MRPGPIKGGFYVAAEGKRPGVVPVPFLAVCLGPGLHVELAIDVDERQERLAVTSIRVSQEPGGPAINTTTLGRLPLKALTASAIAEATAYEWSSQTAGRPLPEAGEVATEATRSRRGTLQIRDDGLEEVARVAKRAGRSRIAVVASHFLVSRPTAWRAIKRAEAAGFDAGGN